MEPVSDGAKIEAAIQLFREGEVTLSRAQDRLIGLFDGPPDLAARAEDILQQAAEKYSGWTWKNNAG